MAGNSKDVAITFKANDSATPVIERVNKKIKDVGVAGKNSTKHTNSFGNSLQAIGRAAAVAQGPLGPIAGRIGALSSALTIVSPVALGAATSFAVLGIAFSKGIRDTIAYEKSMDTLLFATGNAAAEFEFLRGVAGKLGVELYSVTQSYAKLAASTRGTDMAGQATRDLFEATMMSATALHLSVDEVSGTLKAYTQMVSKGTVQSEELRGQLGERLVNAFGMAAKAMGKSTAELNKMLENGEVLASDLLPRLTKVIRDDFSGAADTASRSIQANLNRLNTAWTDLGVSIGGSGVADAFSGVAGGAAIGIGAIAALMRKSDDAATAIVRDNKDVLESYENVMLFIGTFADTVAFALEKVTAPVSVLSKHLTGLYTGLTFLTEGELKKAFYALDASGNDVINTYERLFSLDVGTRYTDQIFEIIKVNNGWIESNKEVEKSKPGGGGGDAESKARTAALAEIKKINDAAAEARLNASQREESSFKKSLAILESHRVALVKSGMSKIDSYVAIEDAENEVISTHNKKMAEMRDKDIASKDAAFRQEADMRTRAFDSATEALARLKEQAEAYSLGEAELAERAYNKKVEAADAQLSLLISSGLSEIEAMRRIEDAKSALKAEFEARRVDSNAAALDNARSNLGGIVSGIGGDQSSEEDLAIAAFDRDLERINEQESILMGNKVLWAEKGTELESEIRAAREEAERIHVDKINKIRQKTASDELAINRKRRDDDYNLAASGLASMGSLLEHGGAKSLALSKAFAMGEIVVSTALSAQKAYESQMTVPTIDSPVRAALAAASAIAGGLARMASVASASKGGGSLPSGSGGSVGSSGISAPPPPPPPANEAPKPATNIYMNGTFVDMAAFLADGVIPGLQDQINNSSVVLFDNQSAQAQVLAG